MKIAVIDTETNWADEVMSMGVALSDSAELRPLGGRYYVLTPEYMVGGMYSGVLRLKEPGRTMLCSRQEALENLQEWLKEQKVQAIFAYNARFDLTHLPELASYAWYDIMRVAPYRQYNPFIPAGADCCSTGRLRRNYGVEALLQMMTGHASYRESHNALLDALDELTIMRLLGHDVNVYAPGRIRL